MFANQLLSVNPYKHHTVHILGVGGERSRNSPMCSTTEAYNIKPTFWKGYKVYGGKSLVIQGDKITSSLRVRTYKQFQPAVSKLKKDSHNRHVLCDKVGRLNWTEI